MCEVKGSLAVFCGHVDTEVDSLLRDAGPGHVDMVLVRYCKRCRMIVEASTVETFAVEAHV